MVLNISQSTDHAVFPTNPRHFPARVTGRAPTYGKRRAAAPRAEQAPAAPRSSLSRWTKSGSPRPWPRRFRVAIVKAEVSADVRVALAFEDHQQRPATVGELPLSGDAALIGRRALSAEGDETEKRAARSLALSHPPGDARCGSPVFRIKLLAAP